MAIDIHDTFNILYRGDELRLRLAQHATLGQLAEALVHATGAAAETLKLVVPGRKGAPVQPSINPETRLVDAGIAPGGPRVRLLASTQDEVAAVRGARELPGLPSFEHELVNSMRRRRRGPEAPRLPTGPYTFAAYSTWRAPGLSPPPDRALALLHRLAADPGVVAVMAARRFSVGLLTEMPPEGKVGVSPRCVLGFNLNRGQEIHLRLRTDDLRGFRHYARIRETLVHELTHNVWGEHDANFKALNSELLREVVRQQQQAALAHTLLAGGAYEGDEQAAEAWVDPADVMAASRATSGATLRSLAGGAAEAPGDVRAAAARAALLRQRQAGAGAEAVAAAQGGGAPRPEEEAEDASTAAKEAQLRRLGGLPAEVEPEALFGGGGDAGADAGVHTGAAGAAAPPPTLDARGAEAEAGGAGSARRVEGEGPGASGTAGADAPHASTGDGAAADRSPMDATAAPAAPVADGGNALVARALADGAAALPPDEGGTQAAEQRVPPSQRAPAFRLVDDALLSALPPDDPMLPRVHELSAAAAALAALQPREDAASALATLAALLRNAAAGADPRHRRLRLRNTAFHARVGRHAAALALLSAAGFAREGGGGGEEEVLVLRRDDPGLLWLAAGAVERALEIAGVRPYACGPCALAQG